MEAVSPLVPSLPAAAAPAPSRATFPAMGMLQAGVPLTLLLDLALGVRSSEVYEQEVADLSWVPVVVQRAG